MSIIAAIEGNMEGKLPDAALVRVGGVTFRIHVPGQDLAGLPNSGHIKLLTHLIVREDDLQLYGFAEEQGRRLFEALLSVNGVGPKAALAVLSVLSPSDLAAAIVSGNGAAISRAQGVGKRTAERIILELKSKLDEEFGALSVPAAAGTMPSVADPALQWLLGLGFSAIEARQALGVEHDEGLSLDERVRRALQRMGRLND